MKISQEYAEKIRQPLNNRMRNYTGHQKGLLMMLWPTTERMSSSGIKWAAKCQCGSYALILPCAKGTRSCGCHRSSVSTESGKSKRVLTDEQVFAIRESKLPLKHWAYELGVSISSVFGARSGRRYADVKKPHDECG